MRGMQTQKPIILPILLIAIISFLLMLGYLRFVRAEAYVSGYQGITPDICGLYVGQSQGQEKISLPFYTYWSDTYTTDRKVGGVITRNVVDWLYTQNGTYPLLNKYEDDSKFSYPRSGLIISGTKLNIDIDGGGGVATIKGACDVPIIDTSLLSYAYVGRNQNATTPYNVFTWEVVDENGESHRFRIDEYILKWHFAIGVYPIDESEYRSVFHNLRVWIKLKPNGGDYFRSLEGAQLVNCIFGIAQIEIKDKIVHESNGWKPNPSTPLLVVGGNLDMYGGMNFEPLKENWKGAQQYQGYLINPVVFSEDGWYVCIPIDKIGVWSNDTDVISNFIRGVTSKGGLVDLELAIHAFVIGEWKVYQSYDIDWKGMEPFKVETKGLTDYIRDLFDFVTSPLGLLAMLLFFILIIVILMLMAPALMSCCMMSSSGGRRVEIVHKTRMLNTIRKFRDMYVGKYMRRLYYNILSPPVVFLMNKVSFLSDVVYYTITIPVYKLSFMLTKK